MEENQNNVKPDGGKKKTERYKDPSSVVAKIIISVAIAVLVLVLGLNSFYTVKETEAAVVTTFGKASTNTKKGLNFKIPFIQKVTKVNTTVQGFPIGYADSEDESAAAEEESIMITSDFNFVNVDFYVSYEVKDPIKALYASNNPAEILKNIAMSSIRSTMSAYSVDAALTTGKSEIQANIKQMIINQLEEEDIGISLVDVSMQDVEPPNSEIIDAFKSVETAKQNKESAINEANQYRNEQKPAAEAEADRIRQEAEAEKTARINEANGQVARFNEEYKQYQNYPLITRQRMFYETMEELLPDMKVIINNDDGEITKHYPIESFADFGNGSTKKQSQGAGNNKDTSNAADNSSAADASDNSGSTSN